MTEGRPAAGPEGAETTPVDRVLDAAKACCERWGRHKVTIDDIAAEAGCSRATLYRLFPGGRETLFESLRHRETEAFFVVFSRSLAGVDTLHDLVVACLVHATRQLAADEHLRVLLATVPGGTVHELTVDGLPVIVGVATEFLVPWFAPHIGEECSAELAEYLARVVLSYFLAPSTHHDLADEESAADFARRFVLPAFSAGEVGAAAGGD